MWPRPPFLPLVPYAPTAFLRLRDYSSSTSNFIYIKQQNLFSSRPIISRSGSSISPASSALHLSITWSTLVRTHSLTSSLHSLTPIPPFPPPCRPRQPPSCLPHPSRSIAAKLKAAQRHSHASPISRHTCVCTPARNLTPALTAERSSNGKAAWPVMSESTRAVWTIPSPLPP